MSGFLIRPASIEDAPAIAEIHHRGWLLAYSDFIGEGSIGAKAPDQRLAYWQGRIADPSCIVLVGTTSSGEVMGMVYGGAVLPHDITGGSIDAFDSELYVLHCRQEVQGKGLGRDLTGALAQRFQRQGKNSLVLWAFKDNAFRRFYDRLGGEIVAEGHDDGIADIAYGWRDIGTLVAACGGAADMLKTASDACR